MLSNSIWLKVLSDMAVKNVEQQESAARYMSVVRWQEWIREGPACGLRRQHRYSRCSEGWVPTAVSKGLVARSTTTFADLNAIKWDLGQEGSPVTSQQHVDQEADTWHGIWGKGSWAEDITWPEEM